MNKINQSYRNGVLWALLCNFLWGTTFIGSRYLMGREVIDPVSLSLIRFFLAGGILFLIGLAIYGNKIYQLRIADFFKLAGLGTFGIVGMSVFLFWGQENTTAINSAIIIQINPIIIMLLGIFIGEKISLRQCSGILLSLLGCLLVINILTVNGFRYDFTQIKGDFLVLLSGMCWAAYSVLGKSIVTRIGGFISTVWSMIFGSLQLLLISLIIGNPTLPSTDFDWLVVLYLALIPTALGFYAWYEAWGRIELSLLNVMQYLTPLFTMLMAVIILGEKLTLINITGMVIIILGITLVSGQDKEWNFKARLKSVLKFRKLPQNP